MKAGAGPRILFLDIETSPNVVYSWGVYQENALTVKEHWYILSFAASWRGSKGIIYRGLPDYDGYKGGDSTERKLLSDLHDLLSEADIVVAHNGADFDVRRINARFIAREFRPPNPYKVVDTRRDLTRVASFSSNRLNWLSKQLGIGQKTMEHQDVSLWLGCMAGDKKCWAKMKAYNKHDVVLLEELYEILSPWIRQPNANLWSAGAVCPNPACGSRDLQSRGYSKSKTRKYHRFQCKSCGSWGRSTKSEGFSASITPTTTDIG